MAARVLIFFPGALGDLICLAPTIVAIARRHPSAKIELMARFELAEFAVGRLGIPPAHSGIARAHSIDRPEVAMLFRRSSSHDEARQFFGAFERIYCFFSAGDPHFRHALTQASAPDAVTFHLFRPEAKGHVASAYLNDVTGRSSLEEIALNLLPRDLEEASRVISGIAEAKKFITIFPGSGSPAKNWPIEKFSALADRLTDTTRVVFILGPAEDSFNSVLRDAGHIIVKNQPLGTVAAIAKMASAFVGNDSGVSHLAAATGTPGVVLFGPSDPMRWRPLGRVDILRREPIDSIAVTEILASIAGIGAGV